MLSRKDTNTLNFLNSIRIALRSKTWLSIVYNKITVFSLLLRNFRVNRIPLTYFLKRESRTIFPKITCVRRKKSIIIF